MWKRSEHNRSHHPRSPWKRVADGWFGGDSHPGQEPEVSQNRDVGVDYTRAPGKVNEVYHWAASPKGVLIHPDKSPEELFQAMGYQREGMPYASGTMEVSNNYNVLWTVDDSNMATGPLEKALKRDTKERGWKYEGLTNSDGYEIGGTKKQGARGDTETIYRGMYLPDDSREDVLRDLTSLVNRLTAGEFGLGRDWTSSLAFAATYGFNKAIRPWEYPGAGIILEAQVDPQHLPRGIGMCPELRWRREYPDGETVPAYDLSLAGESPLVVTAVHVFDPDSKTAQRIPLDEGIQVAQPAVKQATKKQGASLDDVGMPEVQFGVGDRVVKRLMTHPDAQRQHGWPPMIEGRGTVTEVKYEGIKEDFRSDPLLPEVDEVAPNSAEVGEAVEETFGDDLMPIMRDRWHRMNEQLPDAVKQPVYYVEWDDGKEGWEGPDNLYPEPVRRRILDAQKQGGLPSEMTLTHRVSDDDQMATVSAVGKDGYIEGEIKLMRRHPDDPIETHIPAGEWYISGIRVNPSYRRQGVATALLERARELFGEVHHSAEETDEGRAWRQSLGQSKQGMADRTGIPELDALIEEYLRSPLGDWTTGDDANEILRDPSHSAGQCDAVAEDFAAFAKARGWDVAVTMTDLDEMGYEPSIDPVGEIMDEDGNIVPGFYHEHTINEVYRLPDGTKLNWPIAIDFTASQYGYTDHPKVSKTAAYWSNETQPASRLKYAEYVAPAVLLKYSEFDRRPDSMEAVANEDYWDELKQHLSKHGMLEPIILSYNPEYDKVWISEGNHRVRAAYELGIDYVPVVVNRTTGGTAGGSAHAPDPVPPTTGALGEPRWPGSFGPSDLGIEVREVNQQRISSVPGVNPQNMPEGMWRTTDGEGNWGQEVEQVDYYGTCFPAGTLVNMGGEYRPIEDIQVGDMVLTHKGRLRPVKQVMQRDYRGELVSLWTSGLTDNVRCTPEHPILSVSQSHEGVCRRGVCDNPQVMEDRHELEWAVADTLREGMYVGVGYMREGWRDQLEYTVPDKYFQHRTRSSMRRVGSKVVPLSDDFLWAVGVFIAEGSAHVGDLAIASHRDEVEIRDRLVGVFEAMGYSTAIVLNKHDKGAIVRVHGRAISEWFGDWIGRGSHNKHIPYDLMNLPIDRLRWVVKGIFDGDGTKSNGYICQTSRVLALQLVELGLRRGLTPYVNIERPRANRQTKTLYVVPRAWAGIDDMAPYWTRKVASGYWHHGGTPLLRLSESPSREDFHGTVYNISVEEDETYVVENMVVHNCDSQTYGVCPECDQVFPSFSVWQRHFKDDHENLPSTDDTSDEIFPANQVQVLPPNKFPIQGRVDHD